MINRYIFFITFLLFANLSNAQTFTILNSEFHSKISNDLVFFKDSILDRPIDEIVNLPDSTWDRYNPDNFSRVEYVKQKFSVWGKVKLINLSQEYVNLWLENHFALMDTTSIYLYSKGYDTTYSDSGFETSEKWIINDSLKSYFKDRFTDRFIYSNWHIIPFSIDKNDTLLFFIKLQNNHGVEVNLHLGSSDLSLSNQIKADFINYSYFGFLILMAIYYILLIIFTKQKLYLTSGLHVIALYFGKLATNGMLYDSLPDYLSHAWFQSDHTITLALGLSNITLTIVAQDSFKLKKYLPFINKYYNFNKIIILVCLLFTVPLEHTELGLNIQVFLFIHWAFSWMFVSTVSFFVAPKNEKSIFIYLILTWFWSFITILFHVVYIANIISTSFFSIELIHFTLSFTTLSLAITLGMHANYLKNDIKQKQKRLSYLKVNLHHLINFELASTVEENQKVEKVQHKLNQNLVYAQNIQNNILQIDSFLVNSNILHFSIFQPKDACSGDYIWSHTTDDNVRWIALVDCTGHGAPGALMSIASAIELKKIINNNSTSSSGYILAELNRNLKKVLHQQSQNAISNHGLDMALCKIDGQSLNYSGARLPLYRINNHKLETIPPTRKSIGYPKTSNDTMFDDFYLELRGEDYFYITSDGFIDQCGGIKGIPFGKRRFSNTIVQASHFEDLSEQKEYIQRSFLDYQLNHEQQDDISLIGFKL